MKLPYPRVTERNPFLYLTVHFDPDSILTTGATNIQVSRVQLPTRINSNFPPAPLATYTPLESRKNRFTFVIDDQVFSQCGGRYMALFYYNGTYVAKMEFIYDKIQPHLMGSSHV